MARRTETEVNDTAAEAVVAKPDARPPKDRPCDVLLYIDGQGAIAMLWNATLPAPADGDRGVRARIPQQHRVRVEPGLSFCPGEQWSKVQQTPSYLKATSEGKLKPIAGQGGDLAAELARVKPRALATMVDHSAHVDSLKRLQELEQAMDDPRMDVLEAIEARLDTLQVAVARHDRQRRAQRRANRGRAPNGARRR